MRASKLEIGVLTMGLGVALLACGSSSSGGEEATTAGGAGSGGSGTATGGNATGTGGTSAAGGTSAGTGGAAAGGSAASSKTGNVIIADNAFKAAGMSFATYSAFAGFSNGSESSGATCTSSTNGACLIAVCVLPGGAGGGGGAGGAPAKPTAGDVHIDGGTDAIVLHPDASGAYPVATGMKALFQGGASLMVTAAGADVPAFMASVTAPDGPIVSMPALPPAGMSLSIDRSMDMEFDWSGATHGNVSVQLTSSSGTKSGVVVCEVAASAGKAVVPAAALSMLDAGMGSFSVSGLSHTDVMAGDYTVRLTAQSSGADANGASAAGVAVLK